MTHVADDSGGPLVVLDAADRERRAVEEARGVAARARVHERELRRGCEAQADDGEEKEEGVEQRWHLSCSAEVSEVNSCWTILELSLAHLDQSERPLQMRPHFATKGARCLRTTEVTS